MQRFILDKTSMSNIFRHFGFVITASDRMKGFLHLLQFVCIKKELNYVCLYKQSLVISFNNRLTDIEVETLSIHTVGPILTDCIYLVALVE